jgi:hypothetical protein
MMRWYHWLLVAFQICVILGVCVVSALYPDDHDVQLACWFAAFTSLTILLVLWLAVAGPSRQRRTYRKKQEDEV